MVLISKPRFSHDSVGTRDETEGSRRGGRHALPLGSIGQMLKVGCVGCGGCGGSGSGCGDTHLITYTLITIITNSIDPQPSAPTPTSPLAFNPSVTGRCAASCFPSGIQGAACHVIQLTHAKQNAEPPAKQNAERIGQQQSSNNRHSSGFLAVPIAAPPPPPLQATTTVEWDYTPPPPRLIYIPFLWTCRCIELNITQDQTSSLIPSTQNISRLNLLSKISLIPSRRAETRADCPAASVIVRALIDTPLLLMPLLLHTCIHSFSPKGTTTATQKRSMTLPLFTPLKCCRSTTRQLQVCTRCFQSHPNAKTSSRIIRDTANTKRLSSCCCLLRRDTSQCEF